MTVSPSFQARGARHQNCKHSRWCRERTDCSKKLESKKRNCITHRQLWNPPMFRRLSETKFGTNTSDTIAEEFPPALWKMTRNHKSMISRILALFRYRIACHHSTARLSQVDQPRSSLSSCSSCWTAAYYNMPSSNEPRESRLQQIRFELKSWLFSFFVGFWVFHR